MRSRALQVLTKVEAGQAFASDLLRGERERFVRELVLGVLRRQLTLDSVLDAYGSRSTESLDAPVRAAVRMGLYQTMFMDGIPPHAAVGETVRTLRLHSQRAYANGLLRSIERESHKLDPSRDRGGAHPSKRFERPGRSVTFFSRRVFPDPEQDRAAYLACVHSHPRLLVERWIHQVGEERAVARLEQGNRVPVLTLRPRAGRIDAAGLLDRLERAGVPARLRERERGPAVVEVILGAGRVLEGALFRAGLFTIQDEAQMAAAEILAPGAGEVVWDACAAPGGKATQLAEQLQGRGQLVATDRSAERLERLRESLQRLGLEDVQVGAHDLLTDDAPMARPARGFDAILLDAPCSNTAVLDRRPEARWRLVPETFAELAALQGRLIEAARAQLAAGGRLVYGVCSHEPEEGEEHGLDPTPSPFVWTWRKPA